MSKRNILLILSAFCLPVFAESLDIVSIEYPPHITDSEPQNGAVGEILHRVMMGSDISYEMDFLSAARAHQEILTNTWCTSFYPPTPPLAQHVLVHLDNQLLNLTLFRLKQDEPFAFESYKPGKIAQLRLIRSHGETKKLEEKGASLFPIESVKQGVNLLTKQRVDYLYTDEISFNYAVNLLNFNGDDFQRSDQVLRQIQIGIWLNLDCPIAVKTQTHLNSKGYNSH